MKPPPAARYEDLLEVPDHRVAEILDGTLYTHPRPAARHARVGSRLGMDLGGPYDGEPDGTDRPGGWWILDEPELHLADDILVPDLAGWRRDRMPVIPDVAYFTLAPDWVCEVLSPSTARLDRTLKMQIYAREGVRYLWMVDPLAQTLESYQLEVERWLLLRTWGAAERARVVPFDGIELELSRWWIAPPNP